MNAKIRPIDFSCTRALARIYLQLGRYGAALVLIAALAGFATFACAQSDEDFMAAREAFRVGNRAKLDAAALRLRAHVLYPYVRYWQMRQRLNDAAPDDVRALIAQLADGPLGDRLRNDWLSSLGKRESWELFDQEHRGLHRENSNVACYALRRRVILGEAQALRTARSLWLSALPAAQSCTPVFEFALQADVISEADIWARIRLALERGQTTLAKRISLYLSSQEGFQPKALTAAAANPRKYLERTVGAAKTRGAREIAMFALLRMARSAPQQAVTRWRAIAGSFSPEERRYVWGRLGYFGALSHDPDALSWFAQSGALNDDQLAWRARAGLRVQQWTEVAASIDAMSEAERAQPEWRYWKARTLMEQGKKVEAYALLVPLGAEHHFYGLLAAEEIGDAVDAPSERFRPRESDIQAFANVPAIRRALALYRLGLRIEGNREWFWAIAQFDDRQLLEAAEYARRNELWAQAINTAERTRSLHDFALRYLAPYREQFRLSASEYGLDEAWVLGVARQESRFVANARSRSGARGLMQLMPATAKWVAGKLGMKSFRQAIVTDLDINISLGTYYLKYALETLDNQPVLASAGYNAGPGRARNWRAPDEMESAIYTETIPFNETRDYVKKVMANATFYARMLGQSLVSLKERIGTIPPSSRAGEQGR